MNLTQQQLTEVVERALGDMYSNNPSDARFEFYYRHSEELAAEIFKQLGDSRE